MQCPIPCDPGLVGITGYMQFNAVRLDGTNMGISNGIRRQHYELNLHPPEFVLVR